MTLGNCRRKRADEDIREEVLVLLNDFLTHADTIGVEVKDGVVTLSGVAEPGEAGHDIVRRIQHLDGVVSVRDRLSYVPSGPDGFDAVASFPAD